MLRTPPSFCFFSARSKSPDFQQLAHALDCFILTLLVQLGKASVCFPSSLIAMARITRQTKEKWSDEQADTWFQIPGQKDIDSLEKANDNIINEITGAAP